MGSLDVAARRKSMGLFEDALKGINANNNKCVDGATLRDPEANEDALVSKPEAVFVAQKVLKRRWEGKSFYFSRDGTITADKFPWTADFIDSILRYTFQVKNYYEWRCLAHLAN